MSEEKNLDERTQPTQSSEMKKDNIDPTETKPPTNILEPRPPDSSGQASTDNMEVHKHPHNIMHKKKWGEYILEFLMIFFAVFLGFLAENMREHKVEQSKAKEFAIALVGNLNADIGQFNFMGGFRIERNKLKDTLLNVLSKPPNPEYDSSIHRLISQGLFSRLQYVPIDATWQQVKSTGALRLINRKVADAALEYYAYISEMIRLETIEATEIKDFTPTLFTFINADYQYARRNKKPFSELKKIRRLKEDPEARNLLFNWVIHFRDVSEGIQQNHYEKNLKRATDLIQLIKKEYHLKN